MATPKKASRELKAVLGRNALRKKLLGFGTFATTKVEPSGKTYRRAAGRRAGRVAANEGWGG